MDTHHDPTSDLRSSDPRTVDLTGVTSLVARNHRGGVTVTHLAAADDDSDGGTFTGAAAGATGAARVRLVPHGGLDLDRATVELVDGVLTVDVPHLDEVDGSGRRRGFFLGPVTIGAPGSSVDVEIELPTGIPVQASTKLGDVRVQGSAGDVGARTGAGDVRVERCLVLTASTGTGDVSVGSCTGGSATTGAGGVTVDSSEGDLHTRTGAGDVRVMASSGGDVSAATGAGDIHLELLSGRCECRSGAGDVTVVVPRSQPVWLDLNAGLGSVRKDVEPVGPPAEGQPHLRVRARTGLGNVTVRHP
jgi:hypothetical protein